jgi:predicted O-linked N-acetylglucosamine transferase (SPINDLY family)
MAIALARDPQRLRALRERLERNRLTAPLFDTDRYVQALERAYERMWAAHADQSPLRSFDVAAGA